MPNLSVTFKVITPLFLGGQRLDEKAAPLAELRAPSIKAALRFWYRAIDPAYRDYEEYIFGSATHGQGLFKMRLCGDIPAPRMWNNRDYGCFDVPRKTPPGANPNTWKYNGIQYFSFPFRESKRSYIPPETIFKVILHFHKEPQEKEQKALLSAIWLLGHIGGLGSRSRRGFGTIALQAWDCSWTCCQELPIAHGQTTRDNWFNVFKQGLDKIKSWHLDAGDAYHTIIGTNTKFCLFNKEHGVTRIGDTDVLWAAALDEAGKTMQAFRQRREIGDYSSDYERVKCHIVKCDPDTVKIGGTTVSPVLLNNAPERADFGLPLTFRYDSLKYPKMDSKGNIKKKKTKHGLVNDYKVPDCSFQGAEHDRNASSIHIRIIQIDTFCYPLYIRLDAPLLEDLKDNKGNPFKRSPSNSILDDFWKEVKKNGKEYAWSPTDHPK